MSSKTVTRQVQAMTSYFRKRRWKTQDSEGQLASRESTDKVSPCAESVYPFPPDAVSSACGPGELPEPGDFYPGSTTSKTKEGEREKQEHKVKLSVCGIPALSYEPQCHPLLQSETYLYYFKNNFKISFLK